MIQTLFFDFDGTIHNALPIYMPALQSVYDTLVLKGLRNPKTFSEEDGYPFLGQTAKEMWESFGPDLSDEDKSYYANQIRDIEETLILEGASKLYDGAYETLKTLKETCHLVFFSNCSNRYLNLMKKAHGLDHLFDDYLTAENFNYQPKAKTLALLKPYFKKDFLFIGDRHHDFEAGKLNDVKTIGCAYGFGGDEVKMADFIIQDIKELLDLIPKLNK